MFERATGMPVAELAKLTRPDSVPAYSTRLHRATPGQSVAIRRRQGNANAVPVESALVTSTTTDCVAPPEVAARVYLPVGTALSAVNVNVVAFAT
jgi:hypothetical protein